MSSCRCRPIPEEAEQLVLTRIFIIFLVIQSIIHIGLCAVAVIGLSGADLFWFLPVDLFSIIVSVIILGLIILVVGYAAASTNTVFSWVLFHILLWAFIAIEIITPIMITDVPQLTNLAKQAWTQSTLDEMEDMQHEWGCCGFDNLTDTPGNISCPAGATTACRDWISRNLALFRDATLIAVFLDMAFVLLIDFAGCGLCFHPDLVTLEAVQKEESTAWSELQMDFARSASGTLSRRASDVGSAGRFSGSI
jgi:hypothetical protein